MIIEDVFKEFASVVGENRNYEISLLDEDGTVIQSTQKGMIGSQIQSRQNSEKQIFYSLDVDGVSFGILLVQGEDVSVFAPLVRDSLVTRIRFEQQKYRFNNQMSNGNQLARMLVDQTSFDTERVIELCDRLGFRTDASRVCVYMTRGEPYTSDVASHINILPDEENTIYSILDVHSLVIFHGILENDDVEQDHSQIDEYLKELERVGVSADHIYVSMPCRKIHEYHYSFEYDKWLERSHFEGKTVYFSDHVFEYLLSNIKSQHVLPLVDTKALEKKNIDTDEMIRIAHNMIDADFSINKTAQNMYLHKNTLLYKLKKYEEVLKINITGSTKGRVVFTLIALALEDLKNRRNVGF